MQPSARSRILLLIPHLGGGGAERVIELLARYLDPEKYEIHLGVLNLKRRGAKALPSSIVVHDLRTTRARFSAVRLLVLIWRLRPQLLLSGMAHLNLLILLMRPLLPRKTRILARQNGEVSATLANRSRIHRSAYEYAYRKPDRVICQTESMARDLRRVLRVPASRLVVLPNPVEVNKIRNRPVRPTQPNPKFTSLLLAVGRLSPEKGFDILIDALASLPLRFATTTLTIAGAGPCESKLKQQVQKLGLTARVELTGQVPDPSIYFPRATAFVLSSRTEALPNALLEATAAGLPLIITPASDGLTDLLKGQEGIWIANEISAAALRDTIQQALDTIPPGRRFAHSWIDRYDISRAIPAYEALLDRTLSEIRD